MSDLKDEMISDIEPLQLKNDHEHPREDYARIIQRLNLKVKKPLKQLREMIEAEIDRIKNNEWSNQLIQPNLYKNYRISKDNITSKDSIDSRYSCE